MKLIKSEKTEACVMEMEMQLEAEPFKEAVQKVYRREAKRYNVPGFRKGRAPKSLIEKNYGEDVFTVDAVNELFPEAFEAALKELDVEPVSRPDAEIVSASETEGVMLKLSVVIKPELNVGKYEGLKATRYVDTVEEAKVDEEIERMRERNSRLITRGDDEAAALEDIAAIDYQGSVDGVLFDGGTAEGHKLTLGSGQFIPGFEEQVVGHKAGEEFDVNVTFPEEYHSDELAGKAAVFKVKLHEIQYKELPELDDEFAKDVSEFDTLDELKKDIREKMQGALDEQSDMEAENALVEQIVETIEGEIPEQMYENRIDEMVRDFGFRLEQQGLNLGTYMQYTGQTMDSFREGFKEQAEKAVKMRLALETVARIEKIEVGEEDIDEEVGKVAEQYNMEKEKVRELMPMDEVAKDLAVNKALKLVKDKATITDKPIAEKPSETPEEETKEEKPKKAAKKTTKTTKTTKTAKTTKSKTAAKAGDDKKEEAEKE